MGLYLKEEITILLTKKINPKVQQDQTIQFQILLEFAVSIQIILEQCLKM